MASLCIVRRKLRVDFGVRQAGYVARGDCHGMKNNNPTIRPP